MDYITIGLTLVTLSLIFATIYLHVTTTQNGKESDKQNVYILLNVSLTMIAVTILQKLFLIK